MSRLCALCCARQRLAAFAHRVSGSSPHLPTALCHNMPRSPSNAQVLDRKSLGKWHRHRGPFSVRFTTSRPFHSAPNVPSNDALRRSQTDEGTKQLEQKVRAEQKSRLARKNSATGGFPRAPISTTIGVDRTAGEG